MKSIIKRDGTRQKFNKNKIIDAVLAAFKEVDGDVTDYALEKSGNIADYIADVAEERELSIEEIQDYVEKGLMATRRKDVARAYILYREKRTQARNKRSALIKEIGEKLTASNVQNQNANVDEFSFGGRKGEAASTLMKQYALDYCMSSMAKENHLNNEIYIHDLDSYAVGMHNCLTVPFDDLLAKGFNTRQTDVRPANSINTAFQLVAVIFQLQSLQQFGGVSASHLDWTMVPYVRKSFIKHLKDGMKYIDNINNINFIDINNNPINLNTINWSGNEIGIERERFGCSDAAYKYAMDMTEKELKQAVEGMYHNLKI